MKILNGSRRRVIRTFVYLQRLHRTLRFCGSGEKACKVGVTIMFVPLQSIARTTRSGVTVSLFAFEQGNYWEDEKDNRSKLVNYSNFKLILRQRLVKSCLVIVNTFLTCPSFILRFWWTFTAGVCKLGFILNFAFWDFTERSLGFLREVFGRSVDFL